jgi:excisionase family DNA binding protein
MSQNETKFAHVFLGIPFEEFRERIGSIVEERVKRVLAEKEPKKYYSMKEAAKRTGKSIHTLYTDHSRGRLQGFKCGKHVKFTEDQLVKYLEGR